VIDLTQSEYGKCAGDQDCFLRDGTSCCGSCDGQGYVPLSSVGFLGASCDLFDCVYCDLPPVPGVRATCDMSTGQCIKEEVLLP
jgi:hypothetical protein